MHITEVIKTEANWGRNAYLRIVEDKIEFDCSDEEYGPIEFPLDALEKAIEKHKKNVNHKSWLEQILKYTKT
jgi:flagellar biosynthesis chaperone FliJ